MYDRLNPNGVLTIRSSYMEGAFRPIGKQVARAREKLAGVDYDTMVGTGLSGALVIPALARNLHKRWAIVRKVGDNSHANTSFEGQLGRRWIFVDDFIQSGATRDRVLEVISEQVRRANEYRTGVSGLEPLAPVFVGTYTYEDGGFKPPKDELRAVVPLEKVQIPAPPVPNFDASDAQPPATIMYKDRTTPVIVRRATIPVDGQGLETSWTTRTRMIPGAASPSSTSVD